MITASRIRRRRRRCSGGRRRRRGSRRSCRPCSSRKRSGRNSSRLGEEVLAVVERGDRGQDEGAGRQLIAPELDRRGQLAGDVDDHRPRPQRLLDRRVEVLVLAGRQRLAQPLQHPRGAQQPLDRPGEPGRGRLVARAEHGDQLVAQLLVAHRAAVLVAGFSSSESTSSRSRPSAPRRGAGRSPRR